MSLDLGTLAYKLGLDTSDLLSGVRVTKAEIRGLDREGSVEAKRAGENIGESLADGIKEKAAALGKVAGAAVGAAISAGVVDNINVDAGNRRLAAQLGLNQTEMKRAGRLAGDIYAANFGESLAQVDDSIRVVLQNTNLALGSIDTRPAVERLLTLANTFDQDLTRSAAAAGQMVRTGMAKDVLQALDILTVGLQGPANKADDLMDTMNEYGTQFRKLGLNGAMSVGLINQAMAAGARDSDVAADALKEFSIRAIDGSELTAASFEGLGLNADRMAARIAAGGPAARAGLGEVLRRLRDVENPARRAQLAVGLFGTQAEDLGDALYAMDTRTAVDGLGKVAGAASRVVDTTGGGAQATIEGYKRKLIDLGRSAIESTGPTAALAAGLAAFGPAVLSVAGPIAQLIAARTLQATAAGAAAGAETAASGAVVRGWVMSSVAAMQGAARMAASWLIAIGPIALVVAAIAGIAFLVWRNWDKVKHYTGAAWDWVVDKVKAVPRLLVGFFMNFTLPGLLIKHWDSIKSGAHRGWQAVTGFIRGIPGQVVGFFLRWTLVGVIISHWQQIKTGVVQKGSDLLNWVKDLPGRIVDKLGNLGTLLKDKGVDLVTGLWNGIQSMGGWLRDKLISWVKEHIPGPIAHALGISSPSRVMADLAQWIPAGVAAGIDRGGSRVDGAVARMAARIILPTVPPLTATYADTPGRPGGGTARELAGGGAGAQRRMVALLERLVELAEKNPHKAAALLARALEGPMIGGFRDGGI